MRFLSYRLHCAQVCQKWEQPTYERIIREDGRTVQVMLLPMPLIDAPYDEGYLQERLLLVRGAVRLAWHGVGPVP